MKIKQSVNRNVTAALEECREVLVRETVGLLKMLGLEEWDTVSIGRVLILYQTEKGGTSETILVNGVSYHTDRDGRLCVDTSFKCEEGFRDCRTSRFGSVTGLSLSNLQTVYEEVRRVVRQK